MAIAISRTDQPNYQQAPVITVSTESPDETKPSNETYTWIGQANDPKKISIPKLGIDTFVQNVGVDQNNQITVPNNIHIAGWFVDSVRPGEKGLSIIDGHINGPTVDDGVFRRLPELAKDDNVSIQLGDGTTHRYAVHEVKTVETKDSADILFSQIPEIEKQVNLITCSGTYDISQKTYDKRTIVILKQL